MALEIRLSLSLSSTSSSVPVSSLLLRHFTELPISSYECVLSLTAESPSEESTWSDTVREPVFTVP